MLPFSLMVKRVQALASSLITNKARCSKEAARPMLRNVWDARVSILITNPTELGKLQLQSQAPESELSTGPGPDKQAGWMDGRSC